MSAGSRSAGSGIRYSAFRMSDKMRQRRDRRILEHQLRSQFGVQPFLEFDDEIGRGRGIEAKLGKICLGPDRDRGIVDGRSEEHTSELQSHSDLVCRLLLEKKKRKTIKRIQLNP